VPRHGKAVRAQEQFYLDAVEAARTDPQGVVEFRPLASPEA